MLDFATCTECGRCQSQCPAWNTGKPLSPKLVIMDLRDHLFAKAPYLIGGQRHAGGGRDRLRGRRRALPQRSPRRPRVRVRPGPRLRARAGRPAAGRHRRGGRRDRPGRAVVVHHLRGVRRAVPGRHRARRPHRRHAPLPGADRVGVPVRARRAVPQPGEQGQPVGAERPQPAGLDQGPADFEVPVFDGELSAGDRVPVLGRLRGRVRRQGAEDRAGDRRAAAPRRRGLRRARSGGDLHRRPRPPVGQRVRVPDARGAERRGAQHRVRGPRAGHPQDRHHLPALLQHPGPRVPAAGRALRGGAPHPAAQHAGPRGQARPGRRAGPRART